METLSVTTQTREPLLQSMKYVAGDHFLGIRL